MILDAVFAEPAERQAVEAIARKYHVPFRGIWLEADPAILKTRVAARAGDASDATAQVIDRQLDYDFGLIRWERIDASGPPEAVVERVRRRPQPARAVPA